MDNEEKKEKSLSVFDTSKLNDPYSFLNITQNLDGSLTRLLPFSKVPPNTQPPPPSLELIHYVSPKTFLSIPPTTHRSGFIA
ncbi:hypothetical protein ACLOJK_034541 [Asimina triloba]